MGSVLRNGNPLSGSLGSVSLGCGSRMPDAALGLIFAGGISRCCGSRGPGTILGDGGTFDGGGTRGGSSREKGLTIGTTSAESGGSTVPAIGVALMGRVPRLKFSCATSSSVSFGQY